MKKVEFMGKKLCVEKKQYRNGRTALQLVTADGENYCTASVNLDDAELGTDEILIKNWSENEGVLDALIKAGIVADTGQTIPTGFVEANVCKLLV